MTGKQQYTLHVVLNVTTYRLTLSEISFLQNCRSKVINGDYECRNRGIASYTGETSMLTSIVCNDRIDNGLFNYHIRHNHSKLKFPHTFK